VTLPGRAELEAQVRRWFLAGNIGDAELDRLHRSLQERAKDQLYVDMLERQFDPANRVGWGTAWWEERQQGRHGTVRPISPADLGNMWLTYDPPAGAPRPRPWCPDSLVGSWRLVGVSKNGRDVSAPGEQREWRLHADGRLDTRGDPRHQGWTWCANQGSNLHLWLYAPDASLPRVWYVDRVEGGQMDVYPPDEAPRFQRWQRTP
jgi:hypothetical protein